MDEMSEKQADRLAECLITTELDDHDSDCCDCETVNAVDDGKCYAKLWLDGDISSQQVIMERGS